MRSHKAECCQSKPHTRVALTILLVFLLVTSAGCNSSPPLSLSDEMRENISLTEAQSLVPFPICLPTYLPAGVELTPRITYHADFGDRQDSDIRLRYYQLHGQELMLEVYQSHAPGVSDSTPNRSENSRETAIRELLAWVIGWPQVNSAREQIVTSVSEYEDNRERWLFEIKEPVSSRANMVEWGSDPVFYQVYSRLSNEEVKQIAKSITDCLTKPTATP